MSRSKTKLVSLESQDVLIKWNSSKRNRNDRYGNQSGDQSSDESTSSCSTSSTTTTNYVNRKAAYESCNSPTSQFGTCYSFVRKALQRFSLSSNTFYHPPPRRTSKSSTNRDSTSTSGFATLEDMPIELRNIEEKHNPRHRFSSGSPEVIPDGMGAGGSVRGRSGSITNVPSKGVSLLGPRAGSLFHLPSSFYSYNSNTHTHNQKTTTIHGPLSASASVSIGMRMDSTSTPAINRLAGNFGYSTAPVSRQNSISSITGNNNNNNSQGGVRRDSLFNLIRNSITKPIRKTVESNNKSGAVKDPRSSSPNNSALQSPYRRSSSKDYNKPAAKDHSSTGFKLNGFLSQHRFSLPVNLRRSSKQQQQQQQQQKISKQSSSSNNKSSNNNNHNRFTNSLNKNNDLTSHLLSSQDSTEVSSELLDNLKDSVDQSVNDEILIVGLNEHETNGTVDLAECSLGESIGGGGGRVVEDDNDEGGDGDDEGEDVGELEGKGKNDGALEREKEDMLMMIRSSVAASVAVGGTSSRKRELWGKIMQKSLSSDSLESKQSKQSRQQSTGTETGTITTTTTNTATTTNTTSGTSNSASTSESSSKLVAYYSMPELRLLSWSSCDEDDGPDEGNGYLRCNRVNRNKPRLSEIHPITFLNSLGINRRESKGSVIRNDSQDTQNALEDTFDHSILEMATISCTSSGSGGTESHPPAIASIQPPAYPPSMIPVTLINKSSFEEPLSNSRPPSSSSTSAKSSSLKERLQLNLPSSSVRSPSECSSTEGYYYDKSEKDGKTVRSLSVEYKPAICSSYRQGLRRFSASPSLLVSKPFFQLAPHTSGHETHPSVDSEESFVTIIPAGRSCRTGSGTIEASLGDEVDSFMDDVILDIDASLGSTEEDEALCEQLTRPLGSVDAVNILGRASVQRTSSLGPRSPGLISTSCNSSAAANINGAVSPFPIAVSALSGERLLSGGGGSSGAGAGGGSSGGGGESDDPTSASTATTKSLASLGSSSKGLDDEEEVDEVVDPDHSDEIRSNGSHGSTPSPPANLHRYFHLFKCGELEEVIEQNVENLHVVKSYYSEHATSWCVVAEKVRVWTI